MIETIPKRGGELVFYLGDLNVCSTTVRVADPFFLEVSKLGLPPGTLAEKNGMIIAIFGISCKQSLGFIEVELRYVPYFD